MQYLDYSTVQYNNVDASLRPYHVPSHVDS